MPVAARELSATLAALIAGAAAGVVLAGVDLRWAATPGYWFTDILTRGALALLIAVAVSAAVARAGSRRTAWALVAVATAVLAPAEWALSTDPTRFPDALLLAESAVAGASLGGATAAVAGRRASRAALVIGVVGGWFVALPWMLIADGTAARIVLPAAGAVAAAVAAVTAGTGFRIAAPDPRSTRFALLAAFVLGGLTWLFGGWIGNGNGPGSFVAITAAALVALGYATHRLSRSGPAGGERRFLAVAVAVAAGLAPVVVTLTVQQSPGAAGALVAAGMVGIAVGLRASGLRSAAPAGLGLLALLLLLGVFAPTLGGDGIPLALRAGVAGVGAGLALGATLPSRIPDATLELAVIVAVSTMFAGFFSASGFVVYRPAADGVALALYGVGWAGRPMSYSYGSLSMLVLLGWASWSAYGRRRPAG